MSAKRMTRACGNTITDLVGGMEAAGFTGQMAARPGARVLCFTCHNDSPAASVELVELGRAEGASDPADMVAVAAVVCPRCGARGTLVMSYGPEAPTEDDEVLRVLDDGRPRTPG
ncbi:MAG: hypothetical protein ACYDAD_11910 [Acidimicrobiales bacterium]